MVGPWQYQCAPLGSTCPVYPPGMHPPGTHPVYPPGTHPPARRQLHPWTDHLGTAHMTVLDLTKEILGVVNALRMGDGPIPPPHSIAARLLIGPCSCPLLATGYWLLATGYWLLVTAGYWLLLDTGYWLLLDTGYWLLATGYWLLGCTTRKAAMRSVLTMSVRGGIVAVPVHPSTPDM